MSDEPEWKPVPGYDGSYEVTRTGRVRRIHANGIYRELHPHSRDIYGFARMNIRYTKKGKVKKIRIMHMVALAWVPKPSPTYRFVAPINGDPSDISPENIYWKGNSTGKETGNCNPKGTNVARRKSREESLAVVMSLVAESGIAGVEKVRKTARMSKPAVMDLFNTLHENGVGERTIYGLSLTEFGVSILPQVLEAGVEARMWRVAEELVLPKKRRKGLRKSVRYEVLSAGFCELCGRSPKDHGVVLHVDHIVPLSAGGSNARENLRPLCADCNLGKSDRLDATARTRYRV